MLLDPILVSEWLQVTQGLELASLLLALVAIILGVIWAFKGPKKATCGATAILFVAAGEANGGQPCYCTAV